jgi:Predicted dehydrogenases and related proteins
MTDVARVAVVGAAGWAGSRHVHAFHDLGARVVALVDPSPRTLELAAEVRSQVLESTEQLQSSDVDLVVVSLPSSMQPSVSADLLRRGLRVLVEKPVGSSPANAEPLAELENVDENLMVGYTLHHHPAAQRLAEWISSANVIGVSVRSAARKLTVDSWRAAPGEGGVAVVNGIHAIEYAASLFPGDATVLSAYISDQLHRSGVPDYTAATLTFQDGPLLRLETYWNPWEHATGLNHNDWSLEIDVVAHEGRRLWSNWSYHEWDRYGSETVHHLPEVDLFHKQAEAALRFAGGQRPTVGYRQALRATEIADAILTEVRERV